MMYKKVQNYLKSNYLVAKIDKKSIYKMRIFPKIIRLMPESKKEGILSIDLPDNPY